MRRWFADTLPGLTLDLRHGLRHARRHPIPSAAVVISLALAIGINTAAFAIVRHTLLAPLPYADPDRLVAVSVAEGQSSTSASLAAPDFLELQRSSTVFQDVAGAVGFTAALAGGGNAIEVRTAMVTWNFFPMLGIDPVLGRHFRAEEQGTPTRRAFITHDLWQGRHGGDPAIIGRTIAMNGSEVEIVGVLPAGFVFHAPEGSASSISSAEALQVWELFRFDLAGFNRVNRFLTTIARPRPGVTWSAVETEMQRFTRQLQGAVADYATRSVRFSATPFKAGVVGRAGTPLWALFGASFLVVCLAAANLMALGFARITARAHELRIRAALGAARSRIFRVVLAEVAILCLFGALLAAVTGHLVLRGVGIVNPDAVPRFSTTSVDGGGLLFALVTATVVAGALGVVSLLVVRLDTTGLGVRGGSRRTSPLLRSGLIMAQVAICLVLLVGTGLLVRTVHAYRATDRGFDPGGRTVTFFPSMGSFRYAGQHDQILAFHAALTERLRANPSVGEVGTTGQLPMTGAGAERLIAWDATTESAWGTTRAEVQVVSDGYLDAVRTPILRGRSFLPSDRRGQVLVAIVDERLAQRAWPGQDPVGRTVMLQMTANGVDSAGPHRVQVVGVVRSVRDDLDASRPGTGRIYVPFAQQPALTFFYVVRTSGPVSSVLQVAQEVIRETDTDIALTRIGSLSVLLDDATRRERLTLLLLSVFAGVAILLALVGIHGMVSFVVARRMPEYGVRLALGAMPRALAARVLLETIVPAVAGVGVGIGFALVGGRALEGLVYGVSVSDPLTYGAASAALITSIAAASAVPAARVLGLEPAKVLAPE